MKKLLIIAAILAFVCPANAFMLVAGKPPSTGPSEAEEDCTGDCKLSSTWTDSTTVLNTAAGSPHVWAGETGSGALSVDTSGNGWNSEANSLKYTAASAVNNYVYKNNFTATTHFAIRFYVDFASIGATNGQYISFATIKDAWGVTSAQVWIQNDSGTLKIYGKYLDDGNTLRGGDTTVTVSSGTAYQIELLFITATTPADGFKINVWAADGQSSVGTIVGNLGTTTYDDHSFNTVNIGAIAGAQSTNTFYIDSVAVYDQGTFIGPRTY